MLQPDISHMRVLISALCGHMTTSACSFPLWTAPENNESLAETGSKSQADLRLNNRCFMSHQPDLAPKDHDTKAWWYLTPI